MESKRLIDSPELMAEFDTDKNSDIDPYNVLTGSHLRVWWKCEKGHSWQAELVKRKIGQGCPYCRGLKVWIGYNDLATTQPLLVDEWDYSKNGELTPNDVTQSTPKYVWWKCAEGHSWKAAISKRTDGQKCPYCRGKKVWKGYNDLSTTHPKLIEEWDWEKNSEKTPDTLSKGSSVKVWWKCQYGHSWEAPISSRTSGFGCPKCTAALHTSFPEKAILFYVSQYFPETIGNYTDKILGWFEVDVYIPSHKIGIEYDGKKWHKNSKNDIRKNRFCSEAGITLIRIREAGCPILDDKNSINIITNGKKDDLQKTIEHLFDILQQETHVQLPLERMVDLNRDEPKIISLMHLNIKNDNLKIKHPLIASEWDYERNSSLLPEQVTCGSDRRVWWKCDKGHSYLTSIANRVSGKGCSICAGKVVLSGYNDVASQSPHLLPEWDYEKNILSPEAVANGSDKKFWWKCNKGHSYECSINNRRAGQGCPYCSGKKVLVGFNDIQTTHPHIVAEWNNQKNAYSPNQITSGSHKRVWWRCSVCNNEWECAVYSRCSYGSGCPYCSGRRSVKGKNDLQTVNPSLANEWNHEKNLGLTPMDVLPNSCKKVWWKCNKGHEWQARIDSRNNGNGCIQCTRGKDKTSTLIATGSTSPLKET